MAVLTVRDVPDSVRDRLRSKLTLPIRIQVIRSAAASH